MAEPSDFGNALLTWTSSTAELWNKNRLNHKSKRMNHSQQFLHHPQIAYHPTHGTNYKLDP